MDGGGNTPRNEERAAEKLMDDYLKSLGLHRKKIAKDGSCLFRAVAEQVLHSQSLHTKVRSRCVEFLKQNRDSYEAFIEGDFEDYLFKLQDPQQWVGEVEINALAVMYKRDFVIFQEPGKPAVNITDNNFKDKVQLCFLNGNHYDSVYPISHFKNAALCQSILYELLYDGVFKVERSSLPCQRTSRPSDLLSDDNMAVCGSSDESDLDAAEPLWVENGTSTRHNNQSHRGRGRGRPLPERVRRSLNPTLFRNIEFDVWHKTKRAQQKMDYCIAAGMQFAAGDRCQVRLDGSGRTYNATIKEVAPNNGPVTVHIEELGRKQVPLWWLRRLPSDENSWSTVVNRDKRLSNGHGEWEERAKGRGRGKHALASSSSVAQATAPGSSGRVQRQHTWPQQATVEEQGGAKGNRKSVSSVDSAFGLTDEQRLAKEEEERNVALVEIQLRDEHSFPALAPGLQGEGGRKKGGEKRRSQRNKTKSPVEDVRTPSPSAGERLKPSTPPLAATTARAANATTPPNPSTLPAGRAPAAPPSRSDSKPARFGSLKASTPTVNSSTAAAASSSTPAASTPKTNTNSYALAAGATPTPPSTPPAAAPSTKPSAPPPSVPSSATQFSCLTPALPAASSPPTSRDLSSPSPPPSSKLPSSSLPPKSSPSSPPSLSLPPPTFIAPIAPSPTAAQGFLPSSSLPRSSLPVSSVLHSPSPPTFSSSSSLIHHAAQVQEAPPASAPTPSSLPKTGGTLATSQTFQSQTSLSQVQPRVSLPQNQILTPQTDAQSSVPQPCLQHQPQTEVASLTLTQIQTSSPQVQTRSEVSQEQPSHPAPGAPYPQTSQTPVPVSSLEQPQPSVTHPPVQLVQPPHPSQVPHPSLSLSTSPTHPPLPSQTSDTQSQKEAPLPPTHSQSPDDAPAQQSNPPHPSHHPQLNSAPLLTQSIPAGTPLQQLSQLYQDLLYPGFPQGEKGDVAQTPAYSCHKSGDDLPQDVNILRFFFNLGVKAYSMPMFPPYIYLLPLQQAHTMTPKIPSRSPSPHYPPCNLPSNPPANPPTRHQEAYQYPPTSASMTAQYDHQAPHMEPPQPGDLSFNQTGYPVTQPPPHRMSAPWQQPQIPPPRNPSFQGYPSTSQTYPGPPPLSQGYHSGQGSGPPLYPQYPPSSLGYPPSSTPEELQVNQGVMEQCQPISGDMMPGQGSSRAPGLLESPGAANMANANNNLTVVVPGFGGALKKEQGESLTRTVLLVDPPLNNMPILVSNPDIKGLPISMTTMKSSSSPGSPSHYDMISKSAVPADKNPAHGHWSHQSPFTPPTVYPQLGLDRHGQRGYPAPVAMAEPLSMGCNTENYRDEHVFKQRRGQGRGRRGRGGHDSVREAYRRKPGGDAGAGFNPSYRRGGR